MARATAFAEAIDLGVAIARTLPEEVWRDWATLYRKPAVQPEPPFANLKSLAYLEDAFLTYWNEASGEHIERFWQCVAERGLPFQRKDLAREILARGRIRTEMEYQTLVDSVVILQQAARITPADAERLSGMMAEFEQRARSPKQNRSR